VRAITSDNCLDELEADVDTAVRAIENTGNAVNAKKAGFLVAFLDTRTVRTGQIITVMGEATPATQELKVLGVTLDATMQFIGHIKSKTVAAPHARSYWQRAAAVAHAGRNRTHLQNLYPSGHVLRTGFDPWCVPRWR
jgi:hypothetical protein